MRVSERLSVLDAATENAGLTGLLSPVAAVTFGVIPLEKRRDSLLVACGETWHPACRPFVERAVGMPIETVPYKDEVIRHYALKAYLRECTVNHNTFPDVEFINQAESAELLMTDKVEHIGEVDCGLPGDKLVLLDVTYASRLRNLDGGRPAGEFCCGSLELPFQFDGDGVLVYADDLPDDIVLLLRINSFHDAEEPDTEDTFHGVHAVHIAASNLPYMIHPSEIQITRIAPDGSLTFYLYDRLETLRPGETADWSMSYYFLSLGNRHSRHLTLRVQTLALVDRGQVSLTEEPIEWRDEDLCRWFRLGEEGRL